MVYELVYWVYLEMDEVDEDLDEVGKDELLEDHYYFKQPNSLS